MEQMRSDFEAWMLEDNPNIDLFRDAHGQYAGICTWVAWKAWQASRAAIEIELPGWDDFDTTRQVIGAVEEAIRAAGLRVKEK